MKKRIFAGLTAILTLLALTACGGNPDGKELLKKWTDRLHQKVISTAEKDQAGTDHGRSEGRQYGVKPEQKPIGGSLDRLAGECQQQKK